MPEDIGLYEEFIEKVLAPGGCNLIVMLVRYRYQFKTRPECVNPNGPLSEADVKRIIAICRKHNIRIVPKMNLMGHQSEKTKDSLDGLLRGHPDFCETPDMDEVFYCRSLCPKHSDIKPVVFDLMDELTGVFEADALHIGMDEVFDIGKCERCKDTPTYKLFAEWVNALADHNRKNGVGTFMWGDRLLNGMETGYGPWEGSGNFTEPAIKLLDKDITICDWHYEDMTKFPSVDIFAEAGFKMLISTFRYKAHAEQFVEYARVHDKGHIEGILATTWMYPDSFMRYMLTGGHNADVKNKESTEALSETLGWIFAKE
jgi:hypothetical protein